MVRLPGYPPTRILCLGPENYRRGGPGGGPGDPGARLLLVVPGNPGCSGLYRTFLAELRNRMPAEAFASGAPMPSAWVVPHAGHDGDDDGDGSQGGRVVFCDVFTLYNIVINFLSLQGRMREQI